ncbi:hypothetical protein JG687_00007524 [Phytophthora cactorum]|uniref:RxLR effector protein n=1 Tax=Phytophthora cactorum TaxID=29920 RepID=A0A329S8R4_9STRA|nr:hypothetical protein Pcac1_g5726 [Phytophthora cactorum]KAG2914582.1 hypothetical protein PC114_g8120 [Phytophthora cactorum]KAG2981659.1 hypothetical protein PC118_g10464 [Phytophthora cactorum]KAG3021406.1 hypothetical protein PC120_g8710 [Phytophthora cactorum]KAG3223658.1 hypothetical protein PC129_g5675 [Phytophthora cactorum]
MLKLTKLIVLVAIAVVALSAVAADDDLVLPLLRGPLDLHDPPRRRAAADEELEQVAILPFRSPGISKANATS